MALGEVVAEVAHDQVVAGGLDAAGMRKWIRDRWCRVYVGGRYSFWRSLILTMRMEWDL